MWKGGRRTTMLRVVVLSAGGLMWISQTENQYGWTVRSLI